MYIAGYKMFLDNKLLGVGPRQFRNECQNYPVKEIRISENEKTENAGSQVHYKYRLQFPGETGTTILAIMQSSYHVPKKFELP